MRFFKALILLLLALVVFGSGGFFTYLWVVRPKLMLKQELNGRTAASGEQAPPADPSLPEFENAMKLKKSGDLVQAQAALAVFVEHNPHSARIAEARTALGEVNTDIFFSTIPSPDKEQYVVQPGDALAKIEKKLKTNAELLTRSNNLNDPGKLRVGQVLIVSHPQFSLVVNRRERTVTLLNKGNFFKQYPVKAWNVPDTKSPLAANVKVKEKIAWKDGARVSFGSKDYAGSSRWVSLTAPGYTLYTDPAEGGQKAPSGIALGAEDMEELSTLLTVNLPVTME